MAKSTEPRETIKVVHFSDAHLDLKYKEGATVDCGLAYCCRAESETGQGTIKAGEWGSTTGWCDVPQKTFESVLKQVQNEHADYMVWTGDNTAHDDPWVSLDEVTDTLSSIVTTVQDYFPDSEQNLFVQLGNHDSFPNGQWDFDAAYPETPVRDLLHFWVPNE